MKELSTKTAVWVYVIAGLFCIGGFLNQSILIADAIIVTFLAIGMTIFGDG